MGNEILEEVWKIKDEISKRYDCNIDKMVKNLKKAEEGHKERIVDLSKKAKKAA
jgi:hypothetical protein